MMQEIASTERKCPNCGAPLPVQMSNYIDDEIIECEYCHSKFKIEAKYKAVTALHSVMLPGMTREEIRARQRKTLEFMRKPWVIAIYIFVFFVLPLIFAFFF